MKSSNMNVEKYAARALTDGPGSYEVNNNYFSFCSVNIDFLSYN